jgi:hypothetical protein
MYDVYLNRKMFENCILTALGLVLYINARGLRKYINMKVNKKLK